LVAPGLFATLIRAALSRSAVQRSSPICRAVSAKGSEIEKLEQTVFAAQFLIH
jgi:hypothetical protein